MWSNNNTFLYINDAFLYYSLIRYQTAGLKKHGLFACVLFIRLLFSLIEDSRTLI